MKTYTLCKERAEEDAATKDQHGAITQARWEQIHAIVRAPSGVPAAAKRNRP